MHSAEHLGRAWRDGGRGVFLLTWRAKGELARAYVVLRAALGDDAQLVEHLWEQPAMPTELLAELEARQAAEDEQPAKRLALFLGETIGRTGGAELNGWRRGLARAHGSLIVVHASETAAFRRAAPDLGSFLTGHRADADSLLASWSASTATVLQRWLDTDTLPLPQALGALPGDDLDVEELRAWLAQHLREPAE